MVECLHDPSEEELDALTDLWEASVRASHRFLAPKEIGFCRSAVRTELFPKTKLYVVRHDGRLVAFMGLEAAKNEMLFVAPELRGQGLGSELLRFAVERCGVRQVDVNEENPAAAAYYARHGFRILSRSRTGPSGKPHPILHLTL